MPARYLASPNERLDNRRVNTEPHANDRGIDLQFIVFEFDRRHHQSLCGGPSRAAICSAPISIGRRQLGGPTSDSNQRRLSRFISSSNP
jgi:hypothetical protein